MAEHVTIKDKNFSKGIDARSAETELAEGFVEDAANIDVLQGRLKKRNGYGNFASLPITVKSAYANADSDKLELLLPTSIDLSTTPTLPIIVYGSVDTNIANVDLTTSTQSLYYADASPSIENILPAPYAGPLSFPAPSFVGSEFSAYICEKVSGGGNFSYSPDSISISKATKEITIDYIPEDGNSIISYIYCKDRTYSYSQTTSLLAGTQTITILGSHWSPTTTNIGIEVWEDTGTSYLYVLPEDATITNTVTGDVTITLKVPSGGATYRIFLTSIAESYTVNHILSGEKVSTINIPNAESPFIIPYVYVATSGGTVLSLCEIESIEYDATTNSHNLSFINLEVDPYSINYFWEYGNVTSNKLLIKNSKTFSTSHAYTNFQLVVYGLLPSAVYKNTSDGYVNHIDGYIKEGTASAVSSIHGNIFVEYDKNDTNLPSLFANINGRVSADCYIGPAFQSVSSSRSAGTVVTSSCTLTSQLPCVSAVWQSGNLVKYSLTALAHQVTGTPIQAGDILSVSQLAFSQLNGDFTIVSVDYSDPDLISITVTNPDIIDSSYDDISSGGFAGVFTDRVVLVDASSFLPEDSIISGEFLAMASKITSIENNTTLVVNGITDIVQLAAGAKLSGSRTTTIVPTRTSAYLRTTNYIIAGDVVDGNNLVVSVNPRADESAVASGTSLTVSDTSYYQVGSKILLACDGIYTVESIDSDVLLTLDNTPISATPIIVGYTIQLSEQVTIEDCPTCSIDVERRLYPATAPSASGSLTSNKTASYLPATPDSGALPIRSTMTSDNMYFQDGANPPLKLDGENCIRPSLPNFSPIYSVRYIASATGNMGRGALASFNTCTGYLENNITLNRLTVYFVSANTVKSKATDVNNFTPGDYVKVGSVYTYITSVEVVNAVVTGAGAAANGTTEPCSSSGATTVQVGYIYLKDNITWTSLNTNLTVSKVFTYKYYARLNYIDANRNIIASAAQGYFDTLVTQAEPGNTHFKFIQPPTYDIYDYDKMELELYRTQADGAVFFKIITLPLAFNNGSPYIEHLDTIRDDSLGTSSHPIDPTSVPINGEVGTTFHGLPSAAHITSTNNSLIVGDITSEATLSVNVQNNGRSDAQVLSDFSGAYIELHEKGDGTEGFSQVFEFVSAASYALKGTDVTEAASQVIYTKNSHGYAKGDWVYITYGASSGDAVKDATRTGYVGWWQICAKDTNTFTINCTATGLHDDAELSIIAASTSSRIPVYTGTDSCYTVSIGNSSFSIARIFYRLAQAINAAQRAVDITISGQEAFRPWVMAKHDDQMAGGLMLSSPRYSETLFGLELTGANITGNYNLYANGTLWSGTNVLSQQLRYPSRIVASYQNYPEIFDNIYAVQPNDSDSVVDVNPSDGQEITGIIPFFGDTAFGAALRGGVIVVFKQNSIYLVDLSVKAQGLNPVQRLETSGIGCTYPRSIATSKNAIFFAHRSGVYALRRDLTIQYVGKYIERIFSDSTLDLSHGHHSPIGKKYMLSMSTSEDGRNNAHLVYDHSLEDEGQIGPWTRYEGHFATGWANLNSDELFSSDKGSLYLVSRNNTVEDYNDAGEAITSTILFRLQDFGDSGIRKQLRHVFTHFRPITDLNNVSLYIALDGDNSFDSTDDFIITKGGTIPNTIALTGSKKVMTLGHNIPQERALYFQIKLVENGLNEALDLIGVDYTVLGLSHHGIPDAISTKRS